MSEKLEKLNQEIEKTEKKLRWASITIVTVLPTLSASAPAMGTWIF